MSEFYAKTLVAREGGLPPALAAYMKRKQGGAGTPQDIAANAAPKPTFRKGKPIFRKGKSPLFPKKVVQAQGK
jgi:hypothetical protein